jgi:hypothetical protein
VVRSTDALRKLVRDGLRSDNANRGVVSSLQLAGQRQLARMASEVAKLRRHHSACKLQRAWRSFTAACLTTRHFALSFARTGLTGIEDELLVRFNFFGALK